MQPHDDLFLVKLAVRLAGGHRALERETKITRQVCWRLRKGRQTELGEDSRKRLREYVYGQ